MTLKKRIETCKTCQLRTFNTSLGTICSKTGNLPAFEENCSMFIVDEFEKKIIQNTLKNAIYYIEKEDPDMVNEKSILATSISNLKLKFTRIPVDLLTKFSVSKKEVQAQ